MVASLEKATDSNSAKTGLYVRFSDYSLSKQFTLQIRGINFNCHFY